MSRDHKNPMAPPAKKAAKKKTPARKKTTASQAGPQRRGGGFLWGLLIGLSIAGFFWFQNQDKDKAADALPQAEQPAAANNSATAKPEAKQQESASSSPWARSGTSTASVNEEKARKLPPVRESEFDFYQVLRNYEVVISPEELRDTAPPEPDPIAEIIDGVQTQQATANLNLKPDVTYRIQIGSFRLEEDAERRRANVEVLGLASVIQPVEIRPGEFWNRVFVGPFSNQNDVEDTIRLLAADGIDFLVTRVTQ